MMRIVAPGTLFLFLLPLLGCGSQDYQVGESASTSGASGTTDDLIDLSCNPECRNEEVCVNGSCLCRLGLERCDGVCVNTESDPTNCGACGMDCQGDVCSEGECRESCEGNSCDGACVQVEDDPLNCGGCGEACAADEICEESQCVAYTIPNCAVCPCESCGEETRCCETELDSHPVACVEAEECP